MNGDLGDEFDLEFEEISHNWVEVTTMADSIRRYICTNCEATRSVIEICPEN